MRWGERGAYASMHVLFAGGVAPFTEPIPTRNSPRAMRGASPSAAAKSLDAAGQAILRWELARQGQLLRRGS